jgi:hypothetical protein
MPFTPVELVESVAVKWAKLAVVGMSHETLQYGNTSNYALDGLEFFFRGTTPEEVDAIHEGRKFLLSLAYAPEGAEGLRDGAPPRILFFWPQVVSLTCVLGKIRISHSKFNREGRTTIFRARFDLEEARDVRLTMEQVRAQGTQRSAAAAEESGDATP